MGKDRPPAGAEETLFCANGSTENVHVAMMAEALQRQAAGEVMVEGAADESLPRLGAVAN